MNFFGFSPDSFEQMIRALSLKVFGSGVTIFGNGPDGGREATFQGKVNYPYPPDEIWDGYGVIQAKFKEKLENTTKDQSWAEQQLEDELEFWKTSKKRTPKPDYFVFCTNVELSSASNGGRDKINNLFEKYKASLNLKGYATWDANQLRGLIDANDSIRKRFSHFFTPGDLLAQFAEVLAANTPNPDAVLTSYLCKEILADEDARLSQAGDRSEDRIRLADVFLDLPSSMSSSAEAPESNEGSEWPATSLHDLLKAASAKLDPLALYEHLEANVKGNDKCQPLLGRFVFLGGPGSGKSTIGQFLAQIHRAALLERREPHRLESKVRGVIRHIKKRCEEDQVCWPTTPRYPFRIELNTFAKSLAASTTEGVISLSEYLRKLIGKDHKLSHESLIEWLRNYPWLLILDGLDEVPASSNRREVITAIQNFLNEARDIEADFMIVASSRRDGYAGEFDGDEVSLHHLQPLSKSQALACAQRYINAKVAHKGEQKAAEAMTIIETAIDNPLIARLMCTPLQVTFMVTVVAASGKPSDSRWQLFNDYYRTIYERELHKAVRPFDQVLNERRQDIDALHHRVGFILQCRSESSSGTQADMALNEFQLLVSECLQENGLSGEELTKQMELILGAANQRLVFLTCRTSCRISFDVRSLQEYMAAACITNADSSKIIMRLESIAHSAFWRNTFLFAVGRFFVDPQLRNHRNQIRLLCEDLNRKEKGKAAAKLGSRLALEILESGTIGNVPLVRRSLASCALELLEFPLNKDRIPHRLLSIYDQTLEEEFHKALSMWLGQKDVASALPAWILAQSIEGTGASWASDLVNKHWPTLAEDVYLIIKNTIARPHGPEIHQQQLIDIATNRLIKIIPTIAPNSTINILSKTRKSAEFYPAWLSAINVIIDNNHSYNDNKGALISASVKHNGNEIGLTVEFNSVSIKNHQGHLGKLSELTSCNDLHQDWNCLLKCLDFLQNPNLLNLASALKAIAEDDQPSSWTWWATYLPWPLKICLLSTNSSTELLRISTRIREGLLGGLPEWLQKETDWTENGIEISELCSEKFDGLIALITCARSFSCEFDKTGISLEATKAMAIELQQATIEKTRASCASLLAFYASTTDSLHQLSTSFLTTTLLPSCKKWDEGRISITEEHLLNNPDTWTTFFNHFGNLPGLECSFYSWRIHRAPIEWLLSKFSEDSTLLGLLRLAGYWCANGLHPTTKVQSLYFLDQFACPKHRLAAMLVRISQSDLTKDEAINIAKYIPSVVGRDCENGAIKLLLNTIEQNSTNSGALEMILLALFEFIPFDSRELRGRAEAIRSTFLQAAPSDLNNEKTQELELPTTQERSTLSTDARLYSFQ